MTQGEPASTPEGRKGREPYWAVAPSLVLMALVLGLGLWLPSRVDRLLNQAAGGIGAAASPPVVAQRWEVTP